MIVEIKWPDGTWQELKINPRVTFFNAYGTCRDPFIASVMAAVVNDPAETMRKALAFEKGLRDMIETAIEEYTAYDRGDLCAELDRALGDLIERTIHRYMPREHARDVRRQMCEDLADIVIDYDKSSSNPAEAQSV